MNIETAFIDTATWQHHAGSAARRDMLTTLALDAIRIDGGTQLRAEINQDTVAEYAYAMTEGAWLPPLRVVFDGAHYWLVDGFHRYHANRKIGAVSVECEVIDGTQRDAVLEAVGVNATHGLPRTAADKRKAVGALLADPEWAQWSDREIARRCGVTHPFVAAVRESLVTVTSDAPRERTFTTKHGNTATMRAAAKAKKPAPAKPTAPEPSPEPVKQAAAAAAEAALNDDELPTAEDEVVPDVIELLEETQRLYNQIEALTSGSDDKAEIAKWHRLYEDASRKQGEYGNRIADMERELRLMTKHLRDIGKLFGVDRPSKVLAAARAFVKEHRVPLA